MSEKTPGNPVLSKAGCAPDLRAVLARVRVVLVAPSHPGNIGAAARAMRVMGLSKLVLVQPQRFPDPEASARAAGADGLLETAQVCETLDEALQGCVLTLGCTARQRGVPLPELTPQAGARRLLAASGEGDVALLFGRESSGLENRELQRCQAAVHIATQPVFGSLNLGAAVQLLCYELRMAVLSGGEEAGVDAVDRREDPPATHDELEGFFGHLAQTLEEIEFHKGRGSGTVMARLRRLFLRAELDQREVRILRGILADTRRAAARDDGGHE
ncbi:MAG: RNA methyltransferase [Xanthomonadales bacterium]|nr:RNA methyltransferase [Xanthomonadales bacterium]